ncbi:MAG: dihydroorotate dehydrogenase-like protein [Acidobacteria bacterium]|nr:dihydroorotate dehydrogenase-like protein [Acidobacteriota bacterium]
MLDFTTEYMGLKLKNPIIVGSCGLTNSVESIKKLESNGAAAVVLKSLFEEQILMEVDSLKGEQSLHAEEADYIRGYTRQHNLDEYLKLVSSAKKAVSIPVIASINCVSASEWTAFAGRLQDAGADGLELNMFIMPGNIKQKSEEIEQIYFDIIDEVNKKVSIPIATKIGFYFTGMANVVYNLSIRNVKAVVMFNRFHRPDIDLEKMAIVSADIFSTPEENVLPLRWVGMLADDVKCNLVSTTGIHDGQAVIKNLMAGAKAVQIATILYKKGPEHIREMLGQMEAWMKEKNYKKITDIIGKLSQAHIKDPVLYERSQFMKYFSSAKH